MTIKELSNICGVHYNTMRKWLSENKVDKRDSSKNSLFLITDEVVEKAKKNFLVVDSNVYQTDIMDSILIQQVSQKDKQIVKQQEQIEHLQRLLENQQILTLKAHEKMEALESNAKSKDIDNVDRSINKGRKFWKIKKTKR